MLKECSKGNGLGIIFIFKIQKGIIFRNILWKNDKAINFMRNIISTTFSQQLLSDKLLQVIIDRAKK